MIKIYNDDCLKVLKKMESKSVDLVIIDPPYLFKKGGCSEESRISSSRSKRTNEYSNFANGFNFQVLDELKRIQKKVNIYIFCSMLQVRDLLEYYKDYYCEILVWCKSNTIPVSNMYLQDIEYIIFVREKNVKVLGTYESLHRYTITTTNKLDKQKYQHPTIKPLHLIEKFIRNSSKENDTILDCFMGSGTTGVACKVLKRNFIGIEIDKKWYKIAENRINELSLFYNL